MEAGGKRKRDLECPRITYEAPGRTFERLFREDSLQQLEDIVRRKLGVASDTRICLAQIRGDAFIDLEDEDDFDAFYNAIHFCSAAKIRVTLKNNVTPLTANAQEPEESTGRKKRKLGDAPPPLPTEPPTQTFETPETATEIRPARKRGVSPAQPSGASKPVEGTQTAEPPSKRPKVTAVSSESATQASQPPKGSEPSHKAKVVPENPPPDVAPGPSSPPTSPPVQKTGAIGKKSTKPNSRKGADAPLPGSALAALRAKASKNLEEEKADKADKRKTKSGPDVEERGEGQLPPSIPDAISQVTSPAVQQPLPKETVPKHSEKTTGDKDTKTKSKKAKGASQPNTQASEKPKKTVKSKSKTQDSATTVNSETSSAIASGTESGNLTAISRSIIEKYLRPSPSIVASDNLKSSEDSAASRSASGVLTVPVLSQPTCPYCGRDLTHGRSHCPVIRAKVPSILEDRIAKLKLDNSEDPEGVRADAITVLEAALQRKFGSETKRNSNIPSSDTVASTKLAPSNERAPSAPPKGPGTNPSLPARRSSSLRSSSSSSEEEIPLWEASSSLPLAIQRTLNASRLGPRKSSQLSRTSQHEGSSESESSSEDEAHSKSPTEASPMEFILPDFEDDDSNTSGSTKFPTPPQVQTLLGPDPQTLLPPLADVSGYNDNDLEALVRGPRVSLKPADLSSSSSPESSDSEGLEDVQLENESEQDEPRDRIQKVRQTLMPSNGSSDENADTSDEMEDEEIHPRPPVVPMPPVVVPSGELVAEVRSLSPETPREPPSFQKMGVRSSSAEPDEAGNEAFEDVLAQEDALSGLSRHELTPPPDPSEHVEEEADSTDLRNGHVPDDASAQGPGLDPEEAGNNLKIRPFGDDQSLSSVEPAQDGTHSTHFAPAAAEQPQGIPARESTPKPGIMQRMRNRVGLASPVNEPTLSSTSTATPGTRPPRATIAPLRNQPRPRTRSQSTKVGHKHSKATTPSNGSKPMAKKDAAAVTRLISARSKLPEKNQEGIVGDQEQSSTPLRLPSRAISRAAGANSQATSIVSLADPPSFKKVRQVNFKKSRQVKPALKSNQPTMTSQPQAKGLAEEKEQSLVATGPHASTSRNGEADSTMLEPQSGEQVQDITLPPSPSVSLHMWETLRNETPFETPFTVTQSDPMVDELHSDTDPIPFPLKPQHQRKVSSFNNKQSSTKLGQILRDSESREMKEKENGEGSPPPISSEIQTSFPHSQAPTLIATDSSDSENEVQNAVATKPHQSQPPPSRYRKLSDIADQAKGLFTPKVLRQSTGLRQTATVPSKRKDKLFQFYGKMGKKAGHDEISDYEPDSNSETENASHIPKSRKAGAGLKSRASVL